MKRMKKISFITAGIIMAFSMTLSACGKDESSEPATNKPEEEVPATPDEPDGPDTSEGERRTLVAYYSHSGNTHTIASYIKDALESDIVRIETAVPYPESYDEHLAQAREEVASGYHPELVTHIENIQDYDVIFVGYPIWVETAAPPVASFLASHGLSGKTVVPFCTSGTSSAETSYRLVRSLCPGSIVLEGIQIRRGTYDTAHDRVIDWLRDLGMIK